ncbi:formate dehydrogenase subunit alpha [Photobacterium gaetbulicola]|uniref:Putative formate dehydrogenase, alpha subunit n=1 Tax=Photobacterium gaetbulicola Gung47 TaxID=658445 RepID=A0A0C5WK04_9GAMM|nr:formate dehydrogenase subunit alpha [Photobacterium gaetbulicola]AJR05444.1 putative formate dehydrogenase, alpha subunit [Photobacterium gaetbulicola Gung47]PSU12808.1 formate dehydrogenase subunit alpha [Photobacterium gaetbulicola]
MHSKVVKTVCPFCGVGCGMYLSSDAKGEVCGVAPQLDHPISRGKLCDKGWSTVYAVSPENRITQPLKRERDKFIPISWDEVLCSISASLLDTIEQYGPQAVGVISSARATNEDNYAAQKFARAVLKTNNVDHCARICHSPTVAGLKQVLGSGAMTNSTEDVFKAGVIMVIGADPTENHSVLGGQIIQAKQAGATLIVVDPRVTRLAKLADIHLQLQPGTNTALINAMLHVIIANRWHDQAFVEQRCEGFEALAKHVEKVTPESVEALTGLDPQLIRQAAEYYSQSERSMIMYGMGITQFMAGTTNVIALADLVTVCGHIGKPGTGINPLRGQNNVQGACDMGCLPNVYPGYQLADDPNVQAKFAAAWGGEVASTPGLTSMGMTKAALAGKFKSLILFGEDPVVTDPDQNHVREAYQALDLLVVAELTMTETAKLADFVLPAASFAEKNGTFTNCERRVQCIHPVITPVGEAKGDWQWLQALAKAMGSDQLDWPETEAVFDEMTSLTPPYQGMNYPKLEHDYGLQWPCNDDAPQGTTILHQQQFPIGKARLIPAHYVPIDEPTDEDYPLLLTTNRLHFHYGCGSMSRKSPLLERETPPGILFINPRDAGRLAIKPFAAVGVRSRRGYVETRAMVTEDVPPGVVSMPYHFKEAPSNQLTNTAQDPVTKMPELKACAVSVAALPANHEPSPVWQLKGGGYA